MGNYFCGNSSAGGWVGFDDPRGAQEAAAHRKGGGGAAGVGTRPGLRLWVRGSMAWAG